MKVIVSSVSSDSHTWNLIFMQLYMEELGFEVINLGACVGYDELIKRCHFEKPDLLLISTVNGHGCIEGVNIATMISNYPVLQRMTTVIGGKLTTKGDDNKQAIMDLYNAGFDGVFAGEDSLSCFREFLLKNKFLLKEIA